MASSSSLPRTVEEIFNDFSGRRAGILRALTIDVDKFFALCDPEKDNLSLFGHPNGTWEVALPAIEIPPEFPEPALGINFARDGMKRIDWLSLICIHSDSWLLSVAFYFGGSFNRNERKRLFSLINELPTVYEVVIGGKLLKDKGNAENGSNSKANTKRSSFGQLRINASPNFPEDTDEEDEEEDEEDEEDVDGQSETLCGSCGAIYNADEFWIGCDICESWYHGKCVKITPARAEKIKEYRCPPCNIRRGRQ